MENVIYRGKTSLDELVYGPTVTCEYCVTIADGAFRDIIDEEGKRHVVYADTVELKIIGKSKWVKLPSEYTERRERAYRKYYATNEEWFCELSTEEKAKVFANATYSTAETPLTILWGGKEAEQKKWEMWLKQPHAEKE